MYIVGGDPGPHADIQRALLDGDGSVGAWAATGDLPAPRAQLGAVAYRDALFVLGGYDATSIPQAPSVWVAPLAPETGVGAFTTTIFADFPTARAGHGAVEYNGHLYLVAGSGNDGSATYLDDVQVLDLAATCAPGCTPDLEVDRVHASGCPLGTYCDTAHGPACLTGCRSNDDCDPAGTWSCVDGACVDVPAMCPCWDRDELDMTRAVHLADPDHVDRVCQLGREDFASPDGYGPGGSVNVLNHGALEPLPFWWSHYLGWEDRTSCTLVDNTTGTSVTRVPRLSAREWEACSDDLAYLCE